MKKWIGMAAITLVMALVLLSGGAAAETSGICGDHLTWVLDNDGSLTISGTGEMYDFTSAPWELSMKKVIIEEGVTSIGDTAFAKCPELVDVTLPNSITVIGDSVFYDCISLT